MNRLFAPLLLFCLTFSDQALYSQAGSLDQSFGVNGKIDLASDNPLLGKVIALPDGKILACASEEKPNNEFHIILRRLTNSGLPDTDFGNDSFLKLDFSGVSGGLSTSEYPRDMAILPSGKILLAGTMGIQDLNNAPFVAAFVIRLTSDGPYPVPLNFGFPASSKPRWTCINWPYANHNNFSPGSGCFLEL